MLNKFGNLQLRIATSVSGCLRKAVPMTDEGERPKPCEKPPAREITSEELLRGQSELLIRHGEELYRLKLTRNQKLILQK